MRTWIDIFVLMLNEGGLTGDAIELGMHGQRAEVILKGLYCVDFISAGAWNERVNEGCLGVETVDI